MSRPIEESTLSMPPDRPPVHLVIHRDDATVTVVGVYARLTDANTECIFLGKEAGMQLTGESGETAPDGRELMPIEPMRWDSVAGVSCWVETHHVKLARS